MAGDGKRDLSAGVRRPRATLRGDFRTNLHVAIRAAHRNREPNVFKVNPSDFARLAAFSALAVMLTPTHGVAQSAFATTDATRPTRLDRATEIALAKSAAPANVSADATIYVLDGQDWVVAEEGTNGVECWVSRSRPGSLEPHCFDQEGARTILPIHMFKARQQLRGVAPDEIEREVAEGISNGRFRLPTRPALSYMMSSGQVLISDDGRNVGEWMPHLMIYYPYLESDALGLAGPPSTEAGLVVDPGTALSNLVIVVRDFVDPVTGNVGR